MKKLINWLFLLIMICPTIVLAEENEEKTESEREVVILEKCIDGDTATFKSQTGVLYKTRFLAIDTPETVHPKKGEEPYGKQASEYTCNLLTNAATIELENDLNSDQEDKYGRRLAWIFVDGKLLQESLIEQGLAQVAYLYDDYQYVEKLKEEEQKAKDNQKGIWSTNQEPEKISKEKPKSTSPKEESLVSKLVDDLLGRIFDYIDNLLEKIASWIESML